MQLHNGIFSQVVTDAYLIPEFLNFFFSIFNSALQCIFCSIQIFFYVAEFLQSEAQVKTEFLIPSPVPKTVPATQ